MDAYGESACAFGRSVSQVLWTTDELANAMISPRKMASKCDPDKQRPSLDKERVDLFKGISPIISCYCFLADTTYVLEALRLFSGNNHYMKNYESARQSANQVGNDANKKKRKSTVLSAGCAAAN